MHAPKSIATKTVHAGADLLYQLLQRADEGGDGNGRVSMGERGNLLRTVNASGVYQRGEGMMLAVSQGIRAAHEAARLATGSTAPTLNELKKVMGDVKNAVDTAAKNETLSAKEYETLPRTYKAIVVFARACKKYKLDVDDFVGKP